MTLTSWREAPVKQAILGSVAAAEKVPDTDRQGGWTRGSMTEGWNALFKD